MRAAQKLILEMVVRRAMMNKVTSDVVLRSTDDVRREARSLVNQARASCDKPPLGDEDPIPFEDMGYAAQDILAAVRVTK